MKRLFRIACAVFAAAALSMGVTAAAANDVVDMSNSTHGYVTVNYSSSARLKVGIQYNGGKTVFYDCPSGKDASFSLDKGNGKYTVTLYRNVSGTSYQQVESKSMNVTVKDSYAPYLVSTSEVQFSKGDTVSAKAAELCRNAKTDEAKVIAIYNYMSYFSSTKINSIIRLIIYYNSSPYNNKLANEITSGKITKYIPDTAATLKGTTGICYDFSSLFAAMCRSQGIPCALTKGYAGSSYHAWNKVNLNGKWYQIDLTYAVTRSVKNAKTLHDCVSPLTYTSTSDALAVAAA